MQSKINFDNRAKFMKKFDGLDYFEWYLFVDEPQCILEKIKSVTYYLHESFYNPVHTINNRESAFALGSNGWAAFIIRIEVNFIEEYTQNEIYLLNLTKDWKNSPILPKLRSLMGKRLNRPTLGNIWFDTLSESMHNIMHNTDINQCIIELLTRSEQLGKTDQLISNICKLRPDLKEEIESFRPKIILPGR